MARPSERLKCSEFDGGEVPDSVPPEDNEMQQRKSRSEAEDTGFGAEAGTIACQHDRYKIVARNRHCFGSNFCSEFGGEFAP
jgi:hypothetical protein